MKKIFLTLAIAISSVGLAFADGEEISAKVLHAFNKEFSAAREITWTVGDTYFQASFIYNNRYISAFYDKGGEMLGLTRYISPDDLPMALQSDLKKNYSVYWISDLFELANENGTAYYITLENADMKMTLKASNGKSWSNYKKVKKA
jgi:hypothetical protein